MRETGKSIVALVVTFLLMSTVLSAFSATMTAANAEEQIELDTEIDEQYRNGMWFKIQTDLITILFPSGGKKPMFLWWYSNDTSNIYVVKFKGLIEYMAMDYLYYMHRYQAEGLLVQERMMAKFAGMGPHMNQIRQRIEHWMSLGFFGLRSAFLPFSGCQWNMTGPINVTREDGVSYVSFNFTLAKAPQKFDFAENNVILRARFYTTDATESADGQYNYTVRAGEFKIDLIVKNWEWKIDKLSGLFNDLHDEFNVTIPEMRSGLTLWTDLASISIEDMPLADQDANSTTDVIEGTSRASDIIMDGRRVHIAENRTVAGDDEAPIQKRMGERFRFRFANGSQTLAGFFDFVDKANIINATTGVIETVNVTASYISAGAHMRVFISYPYFGANTLVHDPSIGVESVVPWLPLNLVVMLLVATGVIGAAIIAVRVLRRPVNVLNVR